MLRATFEDKNKVPLYLDDEYAGFANATENAAHYEVGNCTNDYPTKWLKVDGVAVTDV